MRRPRDLHVSPHVRTLVLAAAVTVALAACTDAPDEPTAPPTEATSAPTDEVAPGPTAEEPRATFDEPEDLLPDGLVAEDATDLDVRSATVGDGASLGLSYHVTRSVQEELARVLDELTSQGWAERRRIDGELTAQVVLDGPGQLEATVGLQHQDGATLVTATVRTAWS